MPAPAKQPSPAELAALEHAFAADPTSAAYRPLAEAYLAMRRFMEAMVVCKKGVKTHPRDPTPRLLLARIYAAQGKDAKAAEELAPGAAAPAEVPCTPHAGAAAAQERRPAGATASLRKAWQVRLTIAETLEALQLAGSSSRRLPAAPRGPEPAPGAVARVERRGRPCGGRCSDRDGRHRAARDPAPSASPAAVIDGAAAPGAAALPRRARRAAPSRSPSGTAYARSWPRATPPGSTASRPHATRRRRGIAGGDASSSRRRRCVGRPGGWGTVSSIRKARAVEIDRLLRQSRELIEKDGYASYQRGGAGCASGILDRDRDALGGHAYLAYVDAVRWGELGESEGAARRGEEASRRRWRGSGGHHSHAYAAEAYLTFQPAHGSGRSRAAAGADRAGGREPASSTGCSASLRCTPAIWTARARRSPSRARSPPGDVRSAQMLAERWRRRGRGFEAAGLDAVRHGPDPAGARPRALAARQGAAAPRSGPGRRGAEARPASPRPRVSRLASPGGGGARGAGRGAARAGQGDRG